MSKTLSLTHLPLRQSIPRMAGIAATTIGCLVLSGWALHVDALTKVWPGMVSMKPNTALGLLLSGIALTALSRKTHRATIRVALAAISIITAIVGLLSIGEQLFGWNLQIDQFLFHDNGVMDGSRHPGRMSSATGFCLALIGIALARKALSSSKTPSSFIMALGAVVATAGGLAMAGYLTDAAMGRPWSNYTGMAVHSAIGFACLGGGLLSLGRGKEKWSWALGGLGTAGFIGGIILMLAVHGIAFNSAKQMESAAGWVNHTLSVLKEIHDVRVALASLESGQRGYLITGDERFLASRNEEKKDLDNHLKIVRILTADNHDQQTTLDQVEPAARRRTLFGDQTISVSHTQGLPAGRELVASGEGVALSAELESTLKQMSDREDDLLRQRQLRSRDVSTMTFLLLPLGVLLSLTTLVAGLFLLNSSIHDKRRVEKAIRSQLEAVFQATSDGIVVFDMAGNIIMANESQAHLIGFASAEEMKRNITFFTESYEVATPDGTLVPFEQWPPMKVLRGESVANWELRVRQKDIGREWFFSYSGQPIYNEQGKQTLAVITTHDITERVKAEALAKASARETLQANSDLSFYKFALDEAAIVAVTDARGTITYVNDKFCEISGYAREELIGNNHRLVNSQYHPKSFFVAMYSAIARGHVWCGEICNRAKGGGLYWVDTTIIPTQDASGSVSGYVAIRTEITTRKQTEEELRKSETQLQTIIENISEAVVVSDLDGQLLHFNHAALDMLGYANMNEGRRHFRELAHTHELSDMNGAKWTVDQWPLARILRGEKLRDLEARMQRIGADWQRVYSFGGTIARDADGTPLMAVVTFSDITERQKAESTALLLAAIVESSADAVIGKDLHSIVTSWNDAAEKMFGYSAEEMVGRSITQIIPVDHQDEEEQILSKMRRGERVEHFETQRLRKDGSLVDISVTVSPIKGSHGNFIGASKVARDITGRKQIEVALRDSEERFRLLAEGVHEYAIILLDINGRVVSWNAGAERLKGFKAEEIIGRSISAFYPLEDIAAGKPGMELKAATEQGRWEDEGWRVRADGSQFWANVLITALKDDAGRLRGFSKLTRDITDRKVAAEILFKAGALQRAIFNSGNFSSIATDARGVIQIFNVGAERMLGYSAAEVMNKITPADISDPKEVIARAEALSLELGTQIAPGFEALVFKASRGIEDIYQLTYVRKDGSRFPALVSVTALRDAQDIIIGYLLIGTDNTARIEAEGKISRWNTELEQRIADRTAELAETNSDLEAFTYSVSHDLRAPLRAIDGFSRILQTEYTANLPDEAKRFLGLVRSNVQQMGQLVEDLLSLCRHGRQLVETHIVQPDNIAQQVWQDLNQWPNGRTMAFDVQKLDPCAADPALLKQVFVNLLSNAVKFTRDRDNTQISVGAEKNEAGELVYFVKDNGVGFDMRYVAKLFGVFQRLHRAEDYAGTGVGLAIVQRIIKKHGGRVWAESEPDKGTTISFTLGSDN